jgi:hypothetical protein
MSGKISKIEVLQQSLKYLENELKASTDHTKRVLDKIEETKIKLVVARKEADAALKLKFETWRKIPAGYELKPEGHNGRCGLTFEGKGILSTVSEMDAAVSAWRHYYTGEVSSGDRLDCWFGQRRKKTGWVFWYTDRSGISSKDYKTLQAVVAAAWMDIGKGTKKS